MKANSQQSKDQGEIAVVTEFQRAKRFRPFSVASYFSGVRGIERLHEHLESIGLKDVGHKAEDRQSLLQVQLSKFSLSSPNVGEVELWFLQAELSKKRQGVGYLVHDLRDLVRPNDYSNP